MNQPSLLLETSRFRVVRHAISDPICGEIHRETIEHTGAVAVLPLLDDGRICLIENRRLAVGETLIEIPAGTLESGEDPAAAAQRELEEETGYRAASWEHLLDFYVSPGILNEKMHLFVARLLSPGEQRLEAGEQIQPRVVTQDEALAMVHDGRIRDAKTIVALLYFAK